MDCQVFSQSDDNGEFIIPIQEKSKKLIFTAIGYPKKIIAANQASIVLLRPKEYQLNEIVIISKFETKFKGNL